MKCVFKVTTRIDLMWRTLLGLHDMIKLSMQVPYQGRCLVDAGFANIKWLYQRTYVDSLSDIADVVAKSAKFNSPVTYLNDAGEHTWEWHDWKTFNSNFYTLIRGINLEEDEISDSFLYCLLFPEIYLTVKVSIISNCKLQITFMKTILDVIYVI